MAYLIEIGQPEGHTSPVWWCGFDDTYTGDVNDAIKFATEEDAARVIERLQLPGRPVCHSWSDT